MRIRSIKPEWLEDELMLSLSGEARVLSIGLILLADDYGNGRGSDLFLASRVFPGQPRETLEKAREELERARFVVRYEVDGQTYFHIRSWKKHQKVDKPGKPQVPEFTGGSSTPENIIEGPERESESLAPRARPLPSSPGPDLGPGPGPDPEGGVGGGSVEPEPPSDWDGSPVETPCPLDLAERAEELGVLQEFADKLRVPLPSVVDGAREFVGYWTIGEGMGQRRPLWMRKLREHIRRAHREGRLRAPGAPPGRETQSQAVNRLFARAERIAAEEAAEAGGKP